MLHRARPPSHIHLPETRSDSVAAACPLSCTILPSRLHTPHAMHHPSTPSSSRSGRVPTTPPTQTGYGLATPGAPFMNSRDLPPSPFTPTSARNNLPATPFMGTVPLPHQVHNPCKSCTSLAYLRPTKLTLRFADGLPTPPASPVRTRGQPVLTSILTPQYASAVLFDMRYPIEYIQLVGCDVSCLDAHATTPATDRLQISIFFDTIRVEVTNPAGVTVRDVFYRLFRELSKRAEPLEVMKAAQAKGVQTAAQGHATKRIDLLAPSFRFAGLTYAGTGYSLVVRA